MTWRRLFIPDFVATVRPGLTVAQLRNEITGGLTTAVVALPLALAFGVASGAGPVAGVYGAIATGFFASLFGGTPAQATGPTGPMTVVMAAVVATHAASLAEAFTIVMLGGLLQVGFGVLRVGRYVAYTPYSVISGFMTGIGVIIVVVESLPFLGLPTSDGGVVGTLARLGRLEFGALNPAATGLAVAALTLIVLWPRSIARFVPAPLAVLVSGTVASVLLLPGRVPEVGPVPSGLPTLIVPTVSWSEVPQVLHAAFILALLGSIDTLLTSLVADSITKSQHDPDKELVGQGIGNLAAGLIGALPGAGATMRTVINVRAGGRTSLSGMVHALVLLALVLGLGPVVEHVPHAVLAAILMKVGWDIIDWGYLRRLRRAPREKVVVMLVTLTLTVFVDLITAVGVGIILASFVNSRWLAEEQLRGLRQSTGDDDVDLLTEAERALLRVRNGRILVTVLHGSFSYASARELARRDAQALTQRDVVVYDFSHAGYVDTSAALAIDEMIELSQRSRVKVLVSGLSGRALAALTGLGVLDRVRVEDRFDKRLAAIEAAVQRCQATEVA